MAQLGRLCGAQSGKHHIPAESVPVDLGRQKWLVSMQDFGGRCCSAPISKRSNDQGNLRRAQSHGYHKHLVFSFVTFPKNFGQRNLREEIGLFLVSARIVERMFPTSLCLACFKTIIYREAEAKVKTCTLIAFLERKLSSFSWETVSLVSPLAL